MNRTVQRNSVGHVAIGLVLVMGLVSGCEGRAQPQPDAATPQETPAKPIKVWPVELGTLAETINLRGITLPESNLEIAAETAGRVSKLDADLGDRVKKGQVLARIDYAMQKAQRDQVQAGLDMAEKTHERIVALRADDLASQQQADEALTQVRNAKAALRIADLQLKRSTIRAISDGIVARKHIDAGEYVHPGTPMLQIVDYQTIVVSAQVPESVVARIPRAAPVRVTVDALDREVEGRVHVVVPAAHPVSRTYELRVKVPNPDYAILIGMSVTVRVTTQVHENVVVVPQDIVIESGQGRSVFVEVDGVAVRRDVRVGPVEADRVMIVEGLGMGDRVVIEGQRTLYDGQSVQVASGATARAPTGKSREVPAAP